MNFNPIFISHKINLKYTSVLMSHFMRSDTKLFYIHIYRWPDKKYQIQFSHCSSETVSHLKRGIKTDLGQVRVQCKFTLNILMNIKL